MLTRKWMAAVLLCCAAQVLMPAPSRAQRTKDQSKARSPDESVSANPAAIELRFLQGLRERGYFDLALDHIDKALKAPGLTDDLKGVLNYEVGRSLMEEATATADLDKRQAILEQARQKLDAFTKAFPQHRLASEAMVEYARLNLERGHTSLLLANDVRIENDSGQPIPSARADREVKLATARAALGEARGAYDKARAPLKAELDRYPQFIPQDDPRFDQRERARNGFLDCELQRGVVDYEEAQTYPLGSADRNALLDKAGAHFEQIHKDYRTSRAGLHSRMLQAKCLEEKGELGPAMGIYNELTEHPSPELRGLKRQVGFFRIIVIGKRGEYALAVDEAARWLEANRENRDSEEGLGVQLELAKNILKQLESLQETERDQAIRAAVDRLTEVVRYYSPHKPEALKLLQQYQPRAARRANQLANLSYDDAMSQADTAISTHDWSLAESLLTQALRRAERSREIEKVNRARFMLAYVYYASDRYYEASVLADHLARRYPEGGLSAKAAEVGLAALTQAYNTFTQVDHLSDLDRMIELAKYTAETWPDSDQADIARITLGEITMVKGQYEEASKWLESVRDDSPRRLDAQVKAGDAHWRLAQLLREQDKSAEADTQAQAALQLVSSALASRDQAGTPVTDPARIANVNALAEIHRASGRPKEAIELIEPIAKALEGSSPSAEVVPLYASSLSILLRAHLASGQPDQAIALMKVLESVSPSKSALTQLYYELGRSLKAELESLEKRNNPGAYKKMQDAYRQFLVALANSQAGQSYESLRWAGESMLDLKMPKEAGDVFQKILTTIAKDENFKKQANATRLLLIARMRLASALRQQGDFEKARNMIQALIDENPTMLELLMEKGYLLESEARGRSGGDSARLWEQSLDYWKKLAMQLRQSRQLKTEPFEAWYHVALALEGLGKKREAISTLKGVMTLTPSLGGPEMKTKYETMIKHLSN